MSSVARHLSDLIAATAPIFQMAIPASGEMPRDIQTLTLPCMTGDPGIPGRTSVQSDR